MNETMGGGQTAEDLYKRYQEGDQAAFEALIALFEADLSAFINNLIGDRYEAKHLMLESFARLAVNGRYMGRSSVKTYLYTIARNLTMDYRKAQSREQHISFDELIGSQAADGENPAQHLEQEENRQRIHAVMQELKEEYRIVLELLYFEDLSRTEAALRMHLSTKQISDLAFRAKKSLKKKLENGDIL